MNDCLLIDTARLRKKKLFTQASPVAFSMEWAITTHTNFVQTKEHRHGMAALYSPGDNPTIMLSWQAKTTLPTGEEKLSTHRQLIHLVTTPCNYGGVRWWFSCPSCNRRARVLYFNTKPKAQELEQAAIECRECLEIHYASQMASYIERHRTYERHLLANYGLYWAATRYEWELKEHYLEMTPELWQLRMKSVVSWNTHLLKEIIRTDLLILRTDLAKLRSLRNEADRQVYLEHMREKHRDLDTMKLIQILHQSIANERLLYEINTRDMPDNLLDTFVRLADVGKEFSPAQPIQSGQEVETAEKKIVSLEKLLKEVNKREKKMAA